MAARSARILRASCWVSSCRCACAKAAAPAVVAGVVAAEPAEVAVSPACWAAARSLSSRTCAARRPNHLHQ